ncbi:hypothetical protein MMC07_005958 [Pseudocyphellaria aurata]|nr:hypothetical protein [Pseudocyphellaria aurata]
MRLSSPGSRSAQVRFRWSNTCVFSSSKIPWNLRSAVPCGFLSTLRVGAYNGRIETPPNDLKPENAAGVRFGVPSSKEINHVSEESTGLSQSSSTGAFLSTARDGDSRVEKLLCAPWEQVRVAMGPGEQSQTAMISKSTSSTSQISMEESKDIAGARFISALRQGQPQELLSSLVRASKNPELMDSIPSTTILQIMRLLDPINPYKRFMQGLDPKVIDHLDDNCSETFRDLNKLLADHTSLYKYIIPKLLTHREKLGIQKYEILLNAAAVMGNRTLATDTWKEMVKYNHKPDVVLYNYYFEALCWPGALRNYSWRKRFALAGPSGPKYVVSRMFTGMTAEGVMGDAKTFGLLMTACSRDGDLESVKTIMKTVWKVDVDAIMKLHDESDSRRPDDILPGSALHPTSDLLFTMAHIFGSNNRAAVAMRVVDHVSNRFSVPVDERTWIELATWIYILSRARKNGHRLNGEEEVQLPKWTMEDLCKDMLSTNKLSMYVLDKTIRTLYHRKNPDAMLGMMIRGLDHQNKSPGDFIDSLEKKDKAVDLAQHSQSALQCEINRKRLEKSRDEFWIRQWTELLLDLRRDRAKRYRYQPPHVWERQQVTEVVLLFWRFRHPYFGFAYNMETGQVRLKTLRSAATLNRFKLGGPYRGPAISGAYPRRKRRIKRDFYAENGLHPQDQWNQDDDPS